MNTVFVEFYIPEQKNNVDSGFCTVWISDIYLFRIHTQAIFLIIIVLKR